MESLANARTLSVAGASIFEKEDKKIGSKELPITAKNQSYAMSLVVYTQVVTNASFLGIFP